MAEPNKNKEGGLLQPGEVIKPSLKPEDVPSLVKKVFGLEAVSVKALNSYDDLNFHIKMKDSIPSENPAIKTINPDGYILKVMNSLDSKNLSLVDGQNKMMAFLHEKGYSCPAPQKTLLGEYIHMYTSEDLNSNMKKHHVTRLLTYVPHEILNNIPLTADIIHSAGDYIARLDEDLKEFSHDGIAKRSFTWMMSNTNNLRQYFYAINEEDKKNLLETALKNWDDVVEPVMDALPKGYIHGDFNEQNILVSKKDGAQNEGQSYFVSGVIDFGDINVGCYIFELAILVMSFLTMKNDAELCAHAIAGYNARRTLSDAEWNVLYECVCARLCMSLTLGAYSFSLDPSNKYLLTTAKTGWEALSSLLKDGKQKTLQTWKGVIQKRN